MSSLNSTFAALVETLDTTCLSTFGVGAVLYPQTGGTINFSGIFEPPAMLEEIMPGAGVAVVRFFCRFVDLNPLPQIGDVVSINSVTYDVFDVLVDSMGGASLKLRINDKC